jgi:hypothetical protein
MTPTSAQPQSPSTPSKIRSVSLHGQSATTLLTKVSPNNHLNNSNSNNKTSDTSKDGKEQTKEEEVIYF